MPILLLLLLLLAACPDESGRQCPPNTNVVGDYTVTFTAQDGGNECIAIDPDGGPSVRLAITPPFVKPATLCVATANDGGTQLQLLSPGKGTKRSDLLPDGGFHFTGDPVPPGQTTACICDVNIVETIDGYLLSGGAFALRPDGGLPLITGLTATLVDLVTDAGSGPGCRCSFPCTVTYSLSGSL
ncbi:MAG: hypothetical protein AUG04_02000 [Deltaproteobacteria bacterium 13_1_20CM_2_69_21]|nr:MAG: hypothetical protein AUH38_03460 [Deltaproteobacteria bacterium 13_1_40CM_68_24]OLC71864.1 MAG: hypothetical protein AUH83_15090 [Deltaproteobacteria bacterium 13_1_40CM_4_68_19]OLD09142.1 MAG: hypothetical protein AUI90_05285 [Deltaproteobacteria bacterium 13_1_40CM_3_69_14]OLD46867.1 MAG: hypothetical protein AUI48_06335 [Chloroflexi bacterium 13_1_40CM_2_68_14]OLE64094.1 MAG: hypothetical protein AUG04_02000 [Deltaproteobacteria bacterium 13_1_20CM_2_69_21]